jgi:hypothetical protein
MSVSNKLFPGTLGILAADVTSFYARDPRRLDGRSQHDVICLKPLRSSAEAAGSHIQRRKTLAARIGYAAVNSTRRTN